jgi:hypothetical protein
MNEFIEDIPQGSSIQSGSGPIEYTNEENLDIFDIEEPSFITDMSNNIDKNLEEIQKSISNIEVPTPTNESEISKNTYYNNSKKNYHIIDIFWLNYEGDESVKNNKNLVEFITISYNIDFGNLRINFYQIPDNAVDENVVFNQSLKLLVSGTIYPSSCFKALNYFKPFNCIEQLIIRNNEKWEKERPIVAIYNNKDEDEDKIHLKITNVIDKEEYYYVFKGWQKEAFEKCLKYTYEQGLNLRGGLNIKD